MLKKLFILAMILPLAGFMVNCSDYLSGGILDSDPNRADEVPLLSQLVALQPVSYGFYHGDIGVFVSVWMKLRVPPNSRSDSRAVSARAA